MSHQKGFASIVLLLILIVGASVGIFMYSQRSTPKESNLATVTPRPSDTPITPEVIEDSLISNIYSPSKAYTLTLTPINKILEGSDCKYKIVDANSKEIDTSFIQAEYIKCYIAQAGSSTNPKQFARIRDEYFILEKDPGTVSVFQLKNKSEEKLKYDNSSLAPIEVNNNVTKLLLKNNNNDTFKVLDRSGKQLSEFSVKADRPVQYDWVNEGFVFINRVYGSGETVETSFYFYDLNIMKLQHIVTTDPVSVSGRGCYPEMIQPAKGEIVLSDGGCLTLPTKYKKSDGTIHIPLQ